MGILRQNSKPAGICIGVRRNSTALSLWLSIFLRKNVSIPHIYKISAPSTSTGHFTNTGFSFDLFCENFVVRLTSSPTLTNFQLKMSLKGFFTCCVVAMLFGSAVPVQMSPGMHEETSLLPENLNEVDTSDAITSVWRTLVSCKFFNVLLIVLLIKYSWMANHVINGSECGTQANDLSSQGNYLNR